MAACTRLVVTEPHLQRTGQHRDVFDPIMLVRLHHPAGGHPQAKRESRGGEQPAGGAAQLPLTGLALVPRHVL